MPDLTKPDGESDFYFVPAEDPDQAVTRILDMVKNRIPKGTAYPGEHDAIIDAALWDDVHDVIANNRVKRVAVAKEPSPALLRGLIFTETGVAMTPHHTKKGTRRYRYYVSMDVIKKRPKAEIRGPQRLPGGMVEDAVVSEIRRLLRTPEVAARVSRTLRKDRPDLGEADISASLTQFDEMWKALIPAEQARVVRLLVARVTASEAGLAVDLRHEGLGAIAALMAPAKPEVA